MSKLAEHIKIGRKDPQAGFDFWYDRLNVVTNNGEGGLPAVRALLDEVNEVGKLRTRGRNAGTFKNPQAALDFYCNKYAHELSVGTPTKQATPKRTRKASPAKVTQEVPEANGIQAQLAALQEQLAQLAGIVPDETDDETDDEFDEPDTHTASRRVTRTASTTQEATPAYPEPRDRDADATQGKLWKLNSQGPENGIFLCVIDENSNILAGGDAPITAGEAYDLIGEHIA